jgi:hypothetical protein
MPPGNLEKVVEAMALFMEGLQHSGQGGTP